MGALREKFSFHDQMRRSENGRRRQVTWLQLAVSLLVCGLPLILLIDVRSIYALDWFNHLWTVEYFGEYIRYHASLPEVLMTTSLVGIPVPIFYAGKFYALTGLISSRLGSALAFRIVAFIALLTQFWHVERAVRSSARERSLSLTVATIVSWAIYPLTNLYNRGALTEFIAVAFLTAAAASLFVLVLALSNGDKSYYDAAAFGLLYSVAAFTHPLTALFGGGFLLLIGIVAFLVLRRFWLILVAVFSALMTTAVLGPWYFAVHRFGHSLSLTDPIVTKSWFRKDAFFPESIDNLWSRFSPVPIDLRSIINGNDVSTPYLDAQIMSPLVLLAAGLICIWLKSSRILVRKCEPLLVGILSLSVTLFILLLAVSVNPNLSGLFGGFFDILQFPYRLTTYINLALLFCIFALAGLASPEETKQFNAENPFRGIMLTVCVTISFCALVGKLIHADAIRSVNPQNQIRKLAGQNEQANDWYPGLLGSGPRFIDPPRTFYEYDAYGVADGFRREAPTGIEAELPIAFMPDGSSHFGKVQPVNIELAKPTFIVTNVQAFPWNVLIVDGSPQRVARTYAIVSNSFSNWMRPVVEGVPISAGKHVLEYRFVPDRTWKILDIISWAFLLAWIAGSAIALFKTVRRAKQHD
jgi:hypothetical protein